MRWVQVGLWTRKTSWKSVNIQKICALGLWILFHPDKIFLIFRLSDNWWIKDLGPENEVGKRYFMFHVQTISCSKPYSSLTWWFQNQRLDSRHFVKDQPESTPWRKMATLTLKSSISSVLIKSFRTSLKHDKLSHQDL